ncbi:MAG: ATP-binding protein [Ramlibacter sp.]
MRAAADPVPRNARWRLPAAAAGVAAIYFLGAKLGLALTFAPLPIALLWPPNALLLAALVLSPRNWWWGLVAAAFPAHLLAQAQSGVPLAMTLCWFVSNVTEAVLGAVLLARLGGPGPALRGARSVVAFLFTAALAPFFSSFLDAAFVTAIGWGTAGYATLWEVRFFANTLAILIFVPALVTCVQAPPGEFPRLARARAPEAGILAAGLVAASTIAFNVGGTGPLAPSLLCLPVPFLIWAALRFGPSFISTAYAGVAVLVILSASQRNGPFALMVAEHAALPIQLFLIMMALPLLLLAGLAQDLREAQRGATDRGTTALGDAQAEAYELRRQLTHVTRVASLTDFSATLAHELNQPLAAILSNAQAAIRMLSHDPPNVTEVRAILRDIAESDKRAGTLIHHLRLLMKNSDEQFGPVDANQLVQQVLDLVQGEFISRQVELKTSFASDLPQVHGDPVQLQQLLLNLVLNACEAMQGQRERTLSIDTHHGADGTVQILLRDTGPGIPQALLDRVFEPFYTTKANGLGLGLPICRKVAAAHGGTLSAQSAPGRGASFCCALPAAPHGTAGP